jgi:hypothetical protein
MKCSTCTCTRLPLITTSDGVTRCYPCMCLDTHPLVGRTFVSPESLAWRGWRLGDRSGMTWAEVKAAIAGGAPREWIVEP